jgi:hypothetical protein
MICAPFSGSERRYGLPPGAESSGACAPGIRGEGIRAAPAGERGGVLGAEVANPALDRLKFGDAVIDPALGAVQERRQARTDRLVGAADVVASQPIDLLDPCGARARRPS